MNKPRPRIIYSCDYMPPMSLAEKLQWLFLSLCLGYFIAQFIIRPFV